MDIEEEILADEDERLDFLTQGSNFVSSYKWFFFAGFLILGYFWPKIQKYLDKLYEKYEMRRYEAKYHKNPDLALERLESMQLARQRMQEELNRKAAEYLEKKQERELQLAKEKIAKAEGKENGHRLGDSVSGSSSRSEYHPLMGDSSRGYRAPKRSGCPGGGCGR